MRNGSFRVILLFLCPMVCFALLTGSCTRKKTEKVESVADIQKREGIPVRILTVVPRTLEVTEIAGGTAEGLLQTTVTTIGAGRITDIKVKVGDYVEKNTALMTMDLDAAQNFQLAKTQFESALKTCDRIKALVEQGGASQEMLDNAQTALAAAREALNATRKSEFIQAPFAGTIMAIYPSAGSVIDKTKPVVDIARLDKIRLKATVSEAVINRFKNGQPALAALSGDTIRGSVTEVSLVGSASHTFTVEITLENTRRLIRPGMYLTATVVVERRTSILTLPLETILAEGETKYVYVIKNGLARRTAVTTGMRGGGSYEIVEGLFAGDTVVNAGAGNLTDGAKVKIVQ